MSCPIQGMVVNIYRILRVCLVLVFKNFSYHSVAFSYCCTETSYWNLVMCDMFIVLVQNGPMRVLLPHQGWSHLCGLALLARPLGDLVILCVSPDRRPAGHIPMSEATEPTLPRASLRPRLGTPAPLFSLCSISQSKTRYQTSQKRGPTYFYFIFLIV